MATRAALLPVTTATAQYGELTYTRIQFKHGKSAKAKVYDGQVPALVTVEIRRYNSGMTVGHGHYHRYSHTDPIGAPCGVLGWWSDGRVTVALPGGGCASLGAADVTVQSWPDYVTGDVRAAWDALPRVSRVHCGEIEK